MGRLSKQMQRTVRQRLIETAARHFARAGFEGARIDAISQDAGLAKGTVYNYFPSKQALFGTVIARAAKRAAERFQMADPRGTVRQRLIALAEADVSVLREEEDFTKVIVREAMAFRPETYSIIEAHLAPYVTAVAGVLEHGQSTGELRDDLPAAQLAWLFVGTLSLLYVQHWGSEGAWPTLDEIPALAVTSFLDGAAARPQEAPYE